MPLVPNFIVKFFVKDSILYKNLKALLGFTPSDLSLYELALCHSSSNKNPKENNERLEFLGDAILGAIISEHLYIKYITQQEGYLTDMRSKIVNRHSLNNIARKIGLPDLILYNEKDYNLRSSDIFGNALEALIGAIYIDKGMNKTRTFIRKRILTPFIDLDLLEETEANIKNKLIGWASKEGKVITFEEEKMEIVRGRKRFTIGVYIDSIKISDGTDFKKKEASKIAAEKAIKSLEIIK